MRLKASIHGRHFTFLLANQGSFFCHLQLYSHFFPFNPNFRPFSLLLLLIINL